MVRRKNDPQATKNALIGATLTSLVRHGYHGSSTVAICALAGVARGTMLHHFPSRQALMVAAMEQMLAGRLGQVAGELGALERPELEAMVEVLWAAVQGDSFVVWVELAVASRTESGLGEEFRAAMARFDQAVTHLAHELLPAQTFAPVALEDAVSLAFAALNGMALDLLHKSPDQVARTFKTLVSWVLAQAQGGRESAEV